MTTYRRVHLESDRTITEEVTQKSEQWSIEVAVEEHGRRTAMVFFTTATLEEAQESADAVVQKEDHFCNHRCSDWTKISGIGA